MSLKAPLVWVILWAIVILVLSTIGVGVSLPTAWLELLSWDKLAHAFIYGVFTFFLAGIFLKYHFIRPALWLSFTVSLIYGAIMELIQYLFFPNRFFEVWDIVANLTGALIVIFLLFRFLK
jgi:VanZ family protein